MKRDTSQRSCMGKIAMKSHRSERGASHADEVLPVDRAVLAGHQPGYQSVIWRRGEMCAYEYLIYFNAQEVVKDHFRGGRYLMNE